MARRTLNFRKEQLRLTEELGHKPSDEQVRKSLDCKRDELNRNKQKSCKQLPKKLVRKPHLILGPRH